MRGWPRLRAIGGGVSIESPLSARNGSSIDDRDDMFEKSTLVSGRTHTRNRGLLHGAPLLCKRITTVIGAERPSYARAPGVRTAPTHPAGTRHRAPCPHPPCTGQRGQINRQRETARGPSPTPPRKGQWAHTRRPRETARGPMHARRNDRRRRRPRHVANLCKGTSHKTGTNHAACPIKMPQTATAPAPGQPIGEQSCRSTM